MIYVLMYHRILKKEKITSAYDVDIEAFKLQMKFLSKIKAEVISPKDILTLTQGNAQKKYVLITFDDGYVDNYESALPILKEFGLKATIFLATGWIEEKKDMLSWDQVREMVENNIAIESHTHTHRFLSDLDENEINQEIIGSKKIILEKLGTKSDFLSCPGGRVSDIMIKVGKEIGLKGIFTSVPGINDLDKETQDLKIYKRILVRRNLGIAEFQSIFSKEDKDFLFARFKDAAKNWIKKILGNKFYYLVWQKVKKK